MSSPVLSPIEQISQDIDRLRQLSQVSIQASWQYLDGDGAIEQIIQAARQPWTTADVNARDHVAWDRGQVRWLRQIITVPTDLQGHPLTGMVLRLALTWWAELAEIFVNGQLVQVGDLFDCSTRLLLSEAVVPGDQFDIALRLVSPGHDDGALVKSVCVYESPVGTDPEPAFIANELAVLQTYLQAFAPEKLPTLAGAIACLNWSAVTDKATFTRSLAQLRADLQPFSSFIKQRTIKLLGHAHLDMAWLWAVAETWSAAERTFESVLALQQDFPELIFCHSTPALYDWIEQNRPDLFQRIQQQVKAGNWEPIGGLWVEPELNLINGEAIARQILYGQRYFQEKFGAISPIAWLPDTFGFNWQLPQFLKQGGIDYFVTQKLRWNDTTQFPYELFQWRSPAGAQVLSLMSAPIGEGIDPVKMATYACEWETKTGIPVALWLPGVGDHGGGPTRDMLEVARRWQQSPFFPQLEFTTALAYLKQLNPEHANGLHQLDSTSLPQSTDRALPTWATDLYLEFHRGCYTTHADQKLANRRAETLLYQAELWAALATIGTAVEYPQTELEIAWKKVLFNQFHDILPGSSIPEVFVDADQAWAEVEATGETILARSLTTLAQQITLPNPPYPGLQPLVVFNSLNWARSAILDLPVPENSTVSGVYTADGQPIPYEQSAMGSWLFQADAIPAVGYRLFWVGYGTQTKVTFPAIAAPAEFVLENQWLQVAIDPTTGDLSSVFDKNQQWEVLSGAGNQLQAFTDKGQYWDAWNIDPNYAQQPLPAAELQNIEWLERGELRSRIAVIRTIGQSTFYQEYILEAHSPLLKIETHVDWQESHVLVKVAFPVNLHADHATYEIPCGTIQRPTQPQTEAERAQWEIPALHWADLATDHQGVSLLNDCKYGYDAQPDQLRLTLLRSSHWPHPNADIGHQTFTYALCPHRASWQTAQTVQQGYELNCPLQLVSVEVGARGGTTSLPAVVSLLDLGANNLVLMALKRSETVPTEWILRCYECHGEQVELTLHSDFNLYLTDAVDLLERPSGEPVSASTATVHPWNVASFRVKQVVRS